MILAGDVGGTKTLLGLFERRSGVSRCVHEASFASADHGSLDEIVEAFLDRRPERVRACAVGVAGPVVDGRSSEINLRWPVDARRLARTLGLPAVHVVNDLVATARAVERLAPRKLASLTPGLRARRGNAALIAAGTGLGMALMPWDGSRHHPAASEGGHQDFAPRDDLEVELWQRLRARFGRVSVERVVSGPALSAIYEFLVDTGRARETARMRSRLAASDDRNATIAQAALDGKDRAAGRALDRFVSLYGAAAGDLALVAGAVGGIYVGGGIAPKILPKLRDGTFLSAFRAKGRLSPLVEAIPIKVILEPRAALLGAASLATEPVETAARLENFGKKSRKVIR